MPVTTNKINSNRKKIAGLFGLSRLLQCLEIVLLASHHHHLLPRGLGSQSQRRNRRPRGARKHPQILADAKAPPSKDLLFVTKGTPRF